MYPLNGPVRESSRHKRVDHKSALTRKEFRINCRRQRNYRLRVTARICFFRGLHRHRDLAAYSRKCKVDANVFYVVLNQNITKS